MSESPQGSPSSSLRLDESAVKSPKSSTSPNTSTKEEKSPGGGHVRHGRRALREGEHSEVPQVRSGWGADTEKKPLYSEPKQTQKFQPMDEKTAAAQQQNTAAQEAAHEQLIQEVAHAPIEYHSAMPKQSELERATAAKFQILQQQAAQEDNIDLTCLMATLTGQFDDEDVSWEPDQLLMQLTSELNDRVVGEEEEQLVSSPSFSGGSSSTGGGSGEHGSSSSSSGDAQNESATSASGGGGEEGGGGGRKRKRGPVDSSPSVSAASLPSAEMNNSGSGISPSSSPPSSSSSSSSSSSVTATAAATAASGGAEESHAPAHGRRRKN